VGWISVRFFSVCDIGCEVFIVLICIVGGLPASWIRSELSFTTFPFAFALSFGEPELSTTFTS
jgi:hypothetical protein